MLLFVPKHGVNRELTTTIPSWQGWHKCQTFKAPGDGLAFLFGNLPHGVAPVAMFGNT